MIAGNNSKTAGPLPRWEIPEAWGNAGHCPMCGASPLGTVHLPDLPDYLICPRCELSFEVEMTGCRIHIKNFPDRLERFETELHNRWVEPSILRKLGEKKAPLSQNDSDTMPPTPLSDEDVWNRMLSLYRLGNKPKMIELTLIQSGASREQAEAAFVWLKQRSELDAKRQGRKFWLAGGIASFAAVAILGTWAYTSNRINSRLEEGMADPSSQANDPILPLQAVDLLPDPVKPGFLQSPDTRVYPGGPGLTSCPTTSAAAAELFGGMAGSWQADVQTHSWQMMDSGKSVTISVPAGMYAGYINNQTFKFTSVRGPATISNVNFVAVMCD